MHAGPMAAREWALLGDRVMGGLAVARAAWASAVIDPAGESRRGYCRSWPRAWSCLPGAHFAGTRKRLRARRRPSGRMPAARSLAAVGRAGAARTGLGAKEQRRARERTWLIAPALSPP